MISRTLTLNLAALFFLCGTVQAQSMYETYDGFTVPTNGLLPQAETHPSLWFRQVDIAMLRQKKSADSYLSQLWGQISSNVQSFKGKAAASQNTSNLPRMAKYCAFGWIMNDDSTARQKAIDALLLAYQNVPRTATSANFSDNFDEIYRATWLQNFCLAYDWVQSGLTPQQDSIIRSRLTWEVILLRNHMVDSVRYAPRPHNHRSKPAYAVGTAALTFSEHPRAREWLEFALQQQNTVTKYMFSADGVYREGGHYFVYSFVNALPFLWQYRIVSGVNLFPYYMHAFEYPVRVRSSKGWLPNVEDSYVKPFPSHMIAAAYLDAPTDLHRAEPLARILQWNWFSTSFFTSVYTGASNDVAWDIDEFLTYDPTIPQAAPDIAPTLRLNSGQVVFRSGETFSTAPDRYLLFHGVAEADNHQHPDLLSYVLEYKGTILATDAGYGKDGWSDANRAWYTSASAHNTITVNGAAPLDLAVNVQPTDRHFLSSQFFDLAEKEARTAATNGKIRRGIAFINKDFWVVYDIAAATMSATYNLNIHGRGSIGHVDPFTTWTNSTDTYGKAAQLATVVVSSEQSATTERSGYTSLFKDQVEQTWIEVSQTKDSVMFLHLLYPGDVGTTLPAITQSKQNGALFLGLSRQTDENSFVLQSRSVTVAAGRGTTDATFTWFQEKGDTLLRFAVSEGRTIIWDGLSFLQCDSPLTVAVDYSVSGSTTMYCEAPSSPTVVTVRPFLFPRPVQSLLLNGHSASFAAAENDRISFRLDSASVIVIASSPTTDVPEQRPAAAFDLSPIYPNPFNPSATIRFNLPDAGRTLLRVYNTLGQTVRTLEDAYLPAGYHEKIWNGRDERDEPASSGVYFFEVLQGENRKLTKGVLLK